MGMEDYWVWENMDKGTFCFRKALNQVRNRNGDVDWTDLVWTKGGTAKMVLKVPIKDAKKRSKAMKKAATMSGCVSVQLEGDHMVVIGDGMDVVELVVRLRKCVKDTQLVSISRSRLVP